MSKEPISQELQDLSDSQTVMLQEGQTPGGNKPNSDSGDDSSISGGEATVHSIPAIPVPKSENSGSASAVSGSHSGVVEASSPSESQSEPDIGNLETAMISTGPSDDFDDVDSNSLPTYLLPAVGDKFANFIVEERVGAGGFGAVYRVKNPTLGREEALKVILPEVANERNNDKRFLREVNVISRIEHPNIVRLYNSGTTETGVKWMTMEMLVGTRLDKIIRQQGGLSFEEAKAIMIQLLNGLQAAHSRDLIHRDLKPSNVILTEKEGYGALVKILDFGLAKALGKDENSEFQDLTQMAPNCVFGTPQYMAPEQLQPGLKTGPWSDVYSSALLFMEMLTGKKAVEGNSFVEVAFKQIKEDLAMPSEWKGRAIGAVMRTALAKDASRRFKTAGEFRDALLKVNSIEAPEQILREPFEAHRVGVSGIYLPDESKTVVKEVVKEVIKPGKPVRSGPPIFVTIFLIICTIGFFFLVSIIALLYILGTEF